MTKFELETNISHLHHHLREATDLSEVDKVSIRNEIGYLEDKLSLIDFLSQHDDVDYGYHDQYDQ